MLDEFGGKIQRIQILSFLPTHPPTPKIFSMSLYCGVVVVKMRPKALLQVDAFFHCFPCSRVIPTQIHKFFEEYFLHLNLTTNNESIMGVFKRVFGARFMS